MSRPIQAVVHLDALRHNLQIARQYAGDSQVYAVVKANAYGHGIERVYPAFQSADGFALLDLAEALRLRQLGWQGDILLLEGIFCLEDLFVCQQHCLSFSIHSAHQIDWLQQFQRQHPEARFHVYLKMNSGMNRLGFAPATYRDAFAQLQALEIIASITHMMHFSDADGERFGAPGINYQQQCFEQTIAGLPGKRSLCNSAALLRHAPALHSDVMRSGIMLYGSSPDFPQHTIQDWNLKPSMSLRSEIIAVQQLKAGESIGYGSSFVAEQAMRIGVVACGYADGYQRISPSGTPVLVNSQRSQTLGRVSMDMLAVDLSHLPDTDIGAEVVLWGYSSSGAILPVDEVSQAAGTVGYELMCAITARVPFVVQA